MFLFLNRGFVFILIYFIDFGVFFLLSVIVCLKDKLNNVILWRNLFLLNVYKILLIYLILFRFLESIV